MNTYYTKCGRTFEKSTKAETTGYHLPEKEDGSLEDPQCEDCPFPVNVTEGWPPVHKRYECRAGSEQPNHENNYNGSANDKCTLRVYSLDNEFCERVIEYARSHSELGASYNQDLSDCRRSISVSCSANKKGMVAKQELINKFFPVQGETPDQDMEKEYCFVQGDSSPITELKEAICGFCGNHLPTGAGIGKCELTQESASYYRPACSDFIGKDDLIDEEELANVDLEGQLDTLFETANKFIEKVERNRHSCGSCNMGHWYSHDNTYVNVVQDDGVRTVKRPCEPKTHYCYQFAEGQRKIAADKDFDPDTAPEWCPLGEVTPPTPAPKKQPRSGSQGCQEMREDCPCFCKHNDGCAVLLTTGNALKATIDEFDVDCNVFREREAFVNRKPDSVSETSEIVTETSEPLSESVPDVIGPAEPAQVPAFDYSELDEQTATFLQEKAKAISQIKVRTVHDIGLELKLAHDTLANHKTGTFGVWCESIGINRRTAENYIQAFEYIAKNFRNIEDAAGIQPSLLFAASKPSAPPELTQAVIDGDITKHKDYVKAMEELKAVREAKQKNDDHYNDMLRISQSNTVKTEIELKKAQEKLADLEKARADDKSYYETTHNTRMREIRDLERQIGELKEDADPDRLAEPEKEIAELREQLNVKSIEVPAVEAQEVIPYKVLDGWIQEVREKLLEMLNEPEMNTCLILNHESGMSLTVNIEWENVKESRADVR